MKKPRLKADVLNGEGSVSFPIDWTENDPLLRLDLLQDWIADLNQAYKEAFADNRALMSKVREK